MKKNIIAITLAGLCLAQTVNAVSVTMTDAYLQDKFGVPMTGGRILMLASTTDNDFGRLTTGLLPAPSFIDPLETDDVILYNEPISRAAGDGTEVVTFSFNLSGSLAGGDQLLLAWFPNLSDSATQPGFGQQYGSFRAADWVVPGENGADILINMITPNGFTDFGITANATEAQGRASFSSEAAMIPEPSTATLIALGLLGLFSSRRNRK
jgi:hypothetical protein